VARNNNFPPGSMNQPSSSNPYNEYRERPPYPDHNQEEEEADEESIDGLIDDEADDPHELVYEEQNDRREEQVSRKLLFLVQELGSFKKDPKENIEVYVPGPTCDKAIKELAQKCRLDRPDDLLVKYYLGKWATIKKDLLPLFLAQPKNKKLLYSLLTILSHLTSSVDKKVEKSDEHQVFLEEYKELLALPEFAGNMVAILGTVVSAKDKTKYHDNMIELIMTIIRNILQIESPARTVADTYKESLQLKLYASFSVEGGVFDALTFMCQDMKSPLNRRLRLTYLEIYYNVLSTFPPSFLFGNPTEEQYFKNLREKERIHRIQRLNQLSTRHSRFGAMFQISRKIGGTAAITSNIKFQKDDLNKLDTQRNKPKPNRRFASKDGPLPGNKFIDENHGVLSEEEKKIQSKLKHFVADFLEHAYGSLVDSLYDLLCKDTPELNDMDYLHFFTVTSFGMECYIIEANRQISALPPGSPFVRTQLEESMTCKLQSLISGIQVTLVDLLYKSLLSQVSRKKAEFNIPLFQSQLHYFSQLLQATMLLGGSTSPNDQRNSKLLKQVIFSKEFGKILKIGMNYYEPRLHSKTFAENLLRTTEQFFNLLAKEAKDKIIIAKTDKIVRRALKRPVASESQPNEEGDASNPVNDEVEEDDREVYMAQERKYNYYSEICTFVDYPTVQKYLLLVRGEKLLWNSPALNEAVYHYVQRIVDDVGVSWVFFQNDFLLYFNEILSNTMITLKAEHQPFCSLIRRIVKAFFQTLQTNNCLAIEAWFRFPDAATKDMIINNYTVQEVRPLEAQDGVVEIEKAVLPWCREEDLILVHNFETFKDDTKCYERLAELLRDQAYFREVRDVKMRVRLLRLEQSKDAAMKLVDATHKVKPPTLPQVASRILLCTRVTRQTHLESAIESYLKETVESYEDYAAIFSSTPSSFPLVPLNTDHFDIQKLEGWPTLLKYLQGHPPTIGAAFARLPPFLPLKDLVVTFIAEMHRLKNLSENELLDLAELDKPIKAPLRDKTNNGSATKENGVKKSKKQTKLQQKIQAREEAIRANRELAGLASSDEDIPLNLSSSEEEYPLQPDNNEKSDNDDFALSSPAKSAHREKENEDKSKFRRLKRPGVAMIEESSRENSPSARNGTNNHDDE
jgi:hypothetical protein